MWENIVAGFTSGLVSGIIVGIVLYFLQRKMAHEEVVNINFNKLKKRLPTDIFDYIKPGMGLDKIFETFGKADSYNNEAPSFFDRDFKLVKTHSYLFKFLNANLRITSKDKAVIDTITIFASGSDTKSKYRIKLPFNLRDGNFGYLGQTLLTNDFFQSIDDHYMFRSMREKLFGVKIYGGWGTGYMSYTYFGYYVRNFEGYEKDNRPEYFLGEIIDGVCISMDNNLAVGIGMYE